MKGVIHWFLFIKLLLISDADNMNTENKNKLIFVWLSNELHRSSKKSWNHFSFMLLKLDLCVEILQKLFSKVLIYNVCYWWLSEGELLLSPPDSRVQSTLSGSQKCPDPVERVCTWYHHGYRDHRAKPKGQAWCVRLF